MRISIEKTLASAGVGVADVLTKKYINGFNLGPLNTNDALRFGLAIGSYLVNYLGYERDYSEVVFYSSLPLVVDSVANIIEKETAKTATKQSVIVHTVTPPAPSVPVSSGVPP